MNENVRLRDELRERYDFSHILGTSGAMRQVCEQVVQVARTNTTVLIRGESGTGKELIAQAIHYNSLRARQAVREGELRRASRDADRVRALRLREGRVHRRRAAQEGPLRARRRRHAAARRDRRRQPRDPGEAAAGAAGAGVRAPRRHPAAEGRRPADRGHQPGLEAAVTDGALRQDLLYRLNVFTIFVPPLRERKSDVLLLADHFVEKLSTDHGKQVKRISTPAIDALVGYHWPGNVRELQNVIERAVLVCDGQVIHLHHLPPTLQTAEGSGTANSQSLGDAVADSSVTSSRTR